MGEALDRRTFLKAASTLPCLSAFAGDDARYIVEARFWEKLPHRKIKCTLCPRECVIDDRERGYCGVRENRGGVYYTLVYSRVCAANIDPIEKKPFFHVLPGTLSFSIATAGCNVNCKMCQNWDISQVRPEQVRSIYMPPREVAALARQNQCATVSYTYTEPVIFYEYMMDTAEAARAAGVRNVVVTGGYITTDPLEELCKRVDAVKVDLKAFSEKFYREVVNGELKPVLQTLVTLRKRGTWTEIVYLVVPTLNDSDQEFRQLSRWVKTELGPDVPLHFTRFHPQYLLKNLPVTPVKTLERAKAIADAEGLHYVYLGNVPGHAGENTFCPKCRRLLIEREGFFIRGLHLKQGRCPGCRQTIPGLWGKS